MHMINYEINISISIISHIHVSFVFDEWKKYILFTFQSLFNSNVKNWKKNFISVMYPLFFSGKKVIS